MTIIVRHAGDCWTVEVDGKVIGQANSEANVEALIETLGLEEAWVPSWRFC